VNKERDQIELLLAKVSDLHERMWRSAIQATQDNASQMAVVLPPINEVIGLHSTHLAMAKRHLPVPIMAALMGTAAIGVGLLGFGNGRAGRRFSLLDSVYGAVDDNRPGLPWHRHYRVEQSQFRGSVGCDEVSVLQSARADQIRARDRHQCAERPP
jgi:hypothetical protein